MKVGQVFRYADDYDAEPPIVDGLPNYWHHLRTPDKPLPVLMKGINPIAAIRGRRPAILISSSPGKLGSKSNPWQDLFDPDNGQIRYYGDNKSPDLRPEKIAGNKVLLEQSKLHSSGDRSERVRAAPIVCFRTVKHGAGSGGARQFQGIGIIERVERVTQFEAHSGQYFSNYLFDILIMSLAAEDEEFSWDWISRRYDPTLTDEQLLKTAPSAWRDWVQFGVDRPERFRRSVTKLLTIDKKDQLTQEGARSHQVLRDLYDFYDGRKSRFEALAAEVTASWLREAGTKYREGWITPPGGDWGVDFVGRIDLGSEFGKVKLVLLGQAKCEKLNRPTGGNHVARTIARLKRGWVGAYVTTSYFSDRVQREILSDGVPILLINGQRVAQEVLRLTQKRGFSHHHEFLKAVDASYQTVNRRPEEILFL